MLKVHMPDVVSVLFVDDEPAVRRLAVRLLGNDYWVETAASAESALELMNSRSFDVLITDYNMRGHSGIWLLNVVQQRYPATRRVLLTGQALQELRIHLSTGLVRSILSKPLEPRLLMDCIEAQMLS